MNESQQTDESRVQCSALLACPACGSTPDNVTCFVEAGPSYFEPVAFIVVCKCGLQTKEWWNPNRKAWLVNVRWQGRTKHCGYFADILEAARAYDRKALELFGEFALTNEALGLFAKYEEVHH